MDLAVLLVLPHYSTWLPYAQATRKAKSKAKEVDPSDVDSAANDTLPTSAAVPSPDREFGVQPTEDCPLESAWRTWYRATNHTDKRDPSTFGLPTGTKSALDGSVVATTHVDSITA